MASALLVVASALVFVAYAGLNPVSASTLTDKQAELKAAQAKLSTLQSSLNTLAAKYNRAESNLARTEDDIDTIKKQISQSQQDLTKVEEQLSARIVAIYKSGSSTTEQYLEVLFSESDLASVMQRFTLVGKLAQQDKDLIDQVQTHLDSSKERRAQLQEKQGTQKSQLAEMKSLQNQISSRLQASSSEYSKLKNQVTQLKSAAAAAAAAEAAAKAKNGGNGGSGGSGSGGGNSGGTGTVISGFVFPVDGPHSYVDSFGAPRSGGRTHKGCDIMAARGTRAVACVNGTISATSLNTNLGGITIHLRGRDGTVYYYAHLNAIASGIQAGVSVTAGQLIGYVGNTGDAAGGACHLHFEIRPGGGAAIDSYPTLKAAD